MPSSVNGGKSISEWHDYSVIPPMQSKDVPGKILMA
jgi:hypothetical protein